MSLLHIPSLSRQLFPKVNNMSMIAAQPAPTENKDLANNAKNGEPGEPHACRLLALPLELRLMIYELTLISATTIQWYGDFLPVSRRKKNWPPIPLFCNIDIDHQYPGCNIMSLCFTNRQLFAESASLFYRRNRFQIPAIKYKMPRALRNQKFTENVRYLIFGVTCRLEVSGIRVYDRRITCRINQAIRLCPALKRFTIHLPVLYTKPNLPMRETFWFEVVVTLLTWVILAALIIGFLECMMKIFEVVITRRRV